MLAASTACVILDTVFWIFATMPRLTPEETAYPTPSTSILFKPLLLPTVTHIFVVPISSPTTMGASLLVVTLFSISLLFNAVIIADLSCFLYNRHFLYTRADLQSSG